MYTPIAKPQINLQWHYPCAWNYEKMEWVFNYDSRGMSYVEKKWKLAKSYFCNFNKHNINPVDQNGHNVGF